MKYYDLKTNWRKVKRHIDRPEVQEVLVRDFNRFTWGRWRQKFMPGQVPTEFKSCDWQLEHKGRRPAFWQYTKHAACHWLVNFTLRLAERVEPQHEWQIITSDEHSTVWDGKDLLFDFNFQAMGILPAECYRLARELELPPGEFIEVHWADHYATAVRRGRAVGA